MSSSMQPTCQETAGFLFSHRCKNPATQVCKHCGKAICTDHMRPVPASLLPDRPEHGDPDQPAPSVPPDVQWSTPTTGASAAGAAPVPSGPMTTVCITCRRRLDLEPEVSSAPDDPYVYSSHYYSDYHRYDSSDRYSRADRGAFEPGSQGEAGGAWESDFDAS